MKLSSFLKSKFYHRRQTDRKDFVPPASKTSSHTKIFVRHYPSLKGTKFQTRFAKINSSRNLSEREKHRELGILFGEVSAAAKTEFEKEFAIKQAQYHTKIAAESGQFTLRRRTP